VGAKFLRNVLLKAFLLFILFNLLWTVFNPAGVGKLSLYNILFKGRERLPFGENPSESYNLSLYNLDAMMLSHKLTAGVKPADEFRVIVIGDSSAWGTLLRPEETLAGLLDSAGLATTEERHVRVYNLAYPTLSLTKDLIILEEIKAYQPDLILWLVTLESFRESAQLESPIVANNLDRVKQLVNTYGVDLHVPDGRQSFWQRTIISQRRALADLIRLQAYGVMWSATGIDQTYPQDYTPAARDLEADDSTPGWQPPALRETDVRLDLVDAGLRIAGSVPVWIINEPILISLGLNSDIRYNFYYPRWAYDQYHQLMGETSIARGWTYLDYWDLVPQTEFTNSAIHLTPFGETLLADSVILEMINRFSLITQ
jgi:hypothetical protein